MWLPIGPQGSQKHNLLGLSGPSSVMRGKRLGRGTRRHPVRLPRGSQPRPRAVGRGSTFSSSTASQTPALCITRMSTLKIPSAACSISYGVNHLALKLRHGNCAVLPSRTSLLRLRSRSRRMATATVASAAMEPLEICVKSSVTTPDRLGDCPFSQRILMTMEEKQLPYNMKLVDMGNKPEWFLKINAEGKVPVIKLNEEWIADSDVIVQTLEDKFPSPPLASPPEKATVGSKIFSTFIGFLKSKDPNDRTEQALLNELILFNDYIKENGPYINGKEISAVDLSLGPKLYHLEIALSHYKCWAIPDSLLYVKSYTQSIFSRDSFVKTRALKEDVIAGWRPKVMG